MFYIRQISYFFSFFYCRNLVYIFLVRNVGNKIKIKFISIFLLFPLSLRLKKSPRKIVWIFLQSSNSMPRTETCYEFQKDYFSRSHKGHLTLLIICGSIASSSIKGLLGSEQRACTALSNARTFSCSQLSKASTTTTRRVCCPVKASKQDT